MSAGQVLFSRDGHVGHIVFDNASSLNALSFSMWRQFGAICRDIANDTSLRVVVLRGAGGKAFISGTEIDEFAAFEGAESGLAYEEEIEGHTAALEALPQITIAAVQGWAVGGGIVLSFASDLRICTPESKFGAPMGRSIGNCLSVNNYARLAANVGVAQAKRMLLLGEMVGASELLALGAVHKVVEAAAFDQALTELVDRAAANAPITSQVTKEALRRLMFANLPDTDDLTAKAYASEDFRYGVRAFLAGEKTRNWKGV